MRQLTIDGKPVVVWFGTTDDLGLVLGRHLEVGGCYAEVELNHIVYLIAHSLQPLISCPIDKTERLLAAGIPVLYCFAKPEHPHEGMDPHPEIQQLRHWKIKYPGLVIYGSSEGGASKVPALHSEKFEEYGYS